MIINELMKYFERIDTDTCSCKVCGNELLKKVHNMEKHLKVNHEKTYETFQEASATCEEIIYEKINLEADKKYKWSSLWIGKYMNKIKPGLYECSICCTRLKMNYSSGNLKRHVRSKHPYIYAKETNEFDINNDSDDDNEENDPSKKKYGVQKKQRSRAWISKYITQIQTGVYQCDLCRAKLRMPRGLYGNMKRHFCRKHNRIFLSETNAPVYKLDSKSGDINIVDKSTDDISVNQDEKETDCDSEVENECLMDDSNLEDTGKEESSTKKVYIVNKETMVKSTNIHDDTTEIAIILGPNGILEMSDPEIEDKIKILCENKPKSKRGNSTKTCFWNFFNYVEGTKSTYSCFFCNQKITAFTKSVANLTRHIRSKHKEAYELITRYKCEDEPIMIDNTAKNDTSQKENVTLSESCNESAYDVLNDGYKCRSCNVVLTDIDELALFDHTKKHHPEQIVTCRDQTELAEGQFQLVLIATDSGDTLEIN